MFVITSEACRMIELTYFLKGHVFNFFIKKIVFKNSPACSLGHILRRQSGQFFGQVFFHCIFLGFLKEILN